MSARKNKEQQRKKKRKERQAARRAQPRSRADLGAVELRVPHPELAHAPVYVDSSGTRIPDPFATLGLDPSSPLTPEAVQTAFRAAIAVTPPESDPQRAREILQARSFLLEPKEALTRLLGDLRVPNAEHFVPDYRRAAQAPAQKPAKRTVATDWSSRSRLVALMTLYALLEAELEPNGVIVEQQRMELD